MIYWIKEFITLFVLSLTVYVLNYSNLDYNVAESRLLAREINRQAQVHHTVCKLGKHQSVTQHNRLH